MTNRNYVPRRLRDKELYEFLVYILDRTDVDFSIDLNDVDFKYQGPDKVSREAVQQILTEFGLGTLGSLLDESENIDFNAIAFYASYIYLLKGSRFGYETAIRLLGFDFDLLEWWEQSPKGRPNTMSFNVVLDTSIVPRPYETFQKIKKFTAEYVFPIIDPLVFTISIEVANIAVLQHSYVHQIRYIDIERTIDESLLFSRTRFILEDELGDKWNIKVNNLGDLQAFRTEIGDVVSPFAIFRPNTSLAEIRVNSNGDIFGVDADPLTPILNDFSIIGRGEIEWFFNIANDNIVFVTS
jgi:hypothetical protein